MTQENQPRRTPPETRPETPPLPLAEVLARTAGHFQAWLEDYQDYAEDYMNEAEQQEREQTLEEYQLLTAAADWWSRRFNCPNPAGATADKNEGLPRPNRIKPTSCPEAGFSRPGSQSPANLE